MFWAVYLYANNWLDLVSTDTPGLMTAEDKTKLDTISSGAKVSGITMNGSSVTVDANGVANLGTVLTAHQSISGKEDKSVILTTTATSLSPSLNKCYVLTNTVNTLTVTLNNVAGSYAGATTIILTTGSSHNITFLPGSSITIKYQKGISFAANTSYEINCLWVGTEWIVAVNTLSDTLGG